MYSMSAVGEIEEHVNYLISEKKFKEALDFLNSEIENTLDRGIIALLLYEKAKVTHYMGEHRDSMKYLTESLSLIEEMDDTEFKGEVMFHIASMYMVTGELDKAKKLLERILSILPEDSHFYLAAMHNMGDLYKREGNYEQSLNYFKNCFSKATKYGDNFMAAYASENLAEYYAQEGSVENAIKWLKTSLPFARRAGDNRLVPLIDLVLMMLEGADYEEISKRANEIKTISLPHAHDVADAFYNYSLLLPKDKAKLLLRDAILIYSEVGNGTMQQKCTERMQKLEADEY